MRATRTGMGAAGVTGTIAAAVALALGASALAGCTTSQDAPEADARASAIEPTAPAPEDFVPIDDPPRDSRPVDGPTFSLHAPAEFQQSERPGPEGVPMLVLQASSGVSGGVVEVVAFDEVDPAASATEQLAAMAAAKVDIEGVRDLRREAVEWPGATEAVLVRWSEETATADGTVTQQFAQLAAQVGDERITTVVAVAPVEEFEASGVLDVLRTLTLDTAG